METPDAKLRHLENRIADLECERPNPQWKTSGAEYTGEVCSAAGGCCVLGLVIAGSSLAALITGAVLV